jgi:hypothetical protein
LTENKADLDTLGTAFRGHKQNKPAIGAKRSIGGIVFSGSAAMFSLVVGIALLIEVPVTIYQQEAAWKWPSAPGHILSVSEGVRSGMAVRYDYYVAGRRYEASSGNLPHINRARLRAGNRIMVRYKPSDPKVSVFDPGFPLGSVRELFYGLGSLLVSGLMTILCVSSYRDPANNIWKFGWGLNRRIP